MSQAETDPNTIAGDAITGIGKHLRIASSTQLELRFEYEAQQTQNNCLNIYILFPKAFIAAVSATPQDTFFQDMQVYWRRSTPQFSRKTVKQIIKQFERGTDFKDIRLDERKISLEDIMGDKNQMRWVTTGFIDYFFVKLNKYVSRLQQAECLSEAKAQKSIQILARHLKRSHRLLMAMRHAPHLTQKHASFWSDVDDYLSHIWLEGVARFARCMQSFEEGNELESELKLAIRAEQFYRRLRQYTVLSANMSEVAREDSFTAQRHSKKRIWKDLYLDHFYRSPKNKIDNLAGAVAAFIAAGWAFAANVLIFKYTFFNGYTNLDAFLGFNGFLAVSAILLAYVTKDRMKDFFRKHLSNFFNRGVWDRQIQVSNEGAPVVKLHERFLESPLDELPDKIRSKIEPSKRMYHGRAWCLRRSVDKRKKCLRDPVRATEIIRYNVRRFLPYLDQTYAESYVVNRKGQVQEIRLPKVYYLDVVVEIANKGSSHLDHFRCVLNRKGFLRIQTITD